MSYIRAADPGRPSLRLPVTIRRALGPLALLAASLIGVTIATYLTMAHYALTPLACSTAGVVDCARVTSSAYSVLPATSIPISIPGILWFVVSGSITLATLVSEWNGRPDRYSLRIAHLIWSGLGLTAALYLVYIETVKLHRICEWCTVVHLLILLTFLITLHRVEPIPRRATTP